MKINFRYNGERESKKKQNIQETVEYILAKNYGDTLTHNELIRILGYNINNEDEFKKYKSIMNRIKNFILQYGYVLKGISGIGYYILKPSQVTRHCYKTYVKKSQRMLDKSEFILEHTDKTEMEDIRKEEINNMMTLNQQLIDNMWNTIQESVYHSRLNYYESLGD